MKFKFEVEDSTPFRPYRDLTEVFVINEDGDLFVVHEDSLEKVTERFQVVVNEEEHLLQNSIGRKLLFLLRKQSNCIDHANNCCSNWCQECQIGVYYDKLKTDLLKQLEHLIIIKDPYAN